MRVIITAQRRQPPSQGAVKADNAAWSVDSVIYEIFAQRRSHSDSFHCTVVQRAMFVGLVLVRKPISRPAVPNRPWS